MTPTPERYGDIWFAECGEHSVQLLDQGIDFSTMTPGEFKAYLLDMKAKLPEDHPHRSLIRSWYAPKKPQA
jgi:hypothetical protein